MWLILMCLYAEIKLAYLYCATQMTKNAALFYCTRPFLILFVLSNFTDFFLNENLYQKTRL